jgi:TfoX/Sxy family transcriptional regulator of competence genes
MSSSKDFVDFIVDQINGIWTIKYKRMFGEFALYCNNKVVALICDNKLFVKCTQWGKNFIWNPQLSPAYPWAKPSFLIEDKIDDREWISELIRITYQELPEPKLKIKNT